MIWKYIKTTDLSCQEGAKYPKTTVFPRRVKIIQTKLQFFPKTSKKTIKFALFFAPFLITQMYSLWKIFLRFIYRSISKLLWFLLDCCQHSIKSIREPFCEQNSSFSSECFLFFQGCKHFSTFKISKISKKGKRRVMAEKRWYQWTIRDTSC